jgi:hypothetical protein
MGFKVRSFYVQAGSAEFPTGDTDALRRSSSETLLTKCAQALIDCDCGWQLDTTKSATLTSYTDIPSRNSTPQYYPGLFFTNTISGCKLFMAYFGAETYNHGIKDFSGNDLVKFASNFRYSGVCVSIIPEGSSSVFGDPTTSTFIPTDATRICGTFNITTSSTGVNSVAYNPTAGMYYRYYIGATPHTIFVSVNYDNAAPPGGKIYVPVYTTGRIIGELAHKSDNLNTAKYGTLLFRVPPDTSHGEQWAATNFSRYYLYSGIGYIDVPGNGFNSDYQYGYLQHSVVITKADGTWINTTGTSTNVIYYTPDVNALLKEVHNSSSDARWTPLAVTVLSNNLTTNGIIPGDGFKGYLDTDLYRAGSLQTRGVLLDEGKFLVTQQGLYIGWDPSNDVT